MLGLMALAQSGDMKAVNKQMKQWADELS